MAVATDNFNRANSNDLGANWDENIDAGGFNISANAAIPDSLGGDHVETWNANTFGADQYSQAKLAALSGTSNQAGVGVGVRWAQSAKTGYWAVCNLAASNDTTVFRWSGGSNLSLGQRTAGWTVGDTVKLQIVGTILKVFKNGVQVGAEFDNGDVASGRAAICYSSTLTDADIDDWEGGDVETSSTITPPVGAGSLGGTSSLLGLGLPTQSAIRGT